MINNEITISQTEWIYESFTKVEKLKAIKVYTSKIELIHQDIDYEWKFQNGQFIKEELVSVDFDLSCQFSSQLKPLTWSGNLLFT